MSNGAPPEAQDAVPVPEKDMSLHGDEAKPKKHHSGPRKRRPKKKSGARTAISGAKPLGNAGAAGTCEGCQSRVVDAEKARSRRATKSGLCASAPPFTPPRTAVRGDESLGLSPLGSASTVSSDHDPSTPSRLSDIISTSSSLPVSSIAKNFTAFPPQTGATERAALLEAYHQEAVERAYWTQWVIQAAEKERSRRLNVLKQLQCEEEEEVRRRRQWAIAQIEKEQEAMMREMFLDNMKNTQWFQSTISRFSEDYEVVCPNSWFGCTFSCMLKDLELHLERCVYRQVPDTLDQVVEDSSTDFYSYDVVCPNAVLGCNEICSRENLAEHLANCPINGISREKEWEERLEWRESVILATEQERERRIDEERAEGGADGGGLSFSHLQQLYEEQTFMMQVVLHDEIVDFYQHRQQEAQAKKVWIQQAITMVTEEIQHIWNHSALVEGYGSFATQLHGGSSDVDLVVFGVTEEFNLTCQQCVSALAAHFRGSPGYVDVSAITRASIPLLKVVVVVKIDSVGTSPGETEVSNDSSELRIPFDITFDEPNGIRHNGVASVALVQGLADHFYGLRELTLVLKHFLVERSLNDPYVGGLSSYGLLLMVVYVLQEQGALILTAKGQEIPYDVAGDEDEMKPAVPPDDTARNPRYEDQRRKGEQIAQAIIKRAKQQPKQSNANEKATRRRKARRAVLPSFFTGAGENGGNEAKPYLLGKLLMDFLQFYGNDFRQNVDQVSVLSWEDAVEAEAPGSGAYASAASPAVAMPMYVPSPPHSLSPPPSHSPSPAGRSRSNSPLALVPPLPRDGLLVIQDPLQPENNVGKSCYRVSQVFREFSDFLNFVSALIVRGSVMTTGKKKNDKAIPSSSTASSTPPSKTQTKKHHEPACRILKSVFEMKTREKRASMDFTSPPRSGVSSERRGS